MGRPLKQLTIANAAAGNCKKWEVQKVAKILNRFPNFLESEVIVTSSLKKLEAALIKYRDYHPDILGFMGGDATLSQGLTKAEEIWGWIPNQIAHFPAGKVCNLANELRLNGGLRDKLKKRVQIPYTEAIQLAREMSDKASFNQEFKTEEIDLLDVNGRKGFNVALGAAPKLIWAYFHHSKIEYNRLEERLKISATEEYQKVIDQCFQNSNGLLRSLGAVYALSTALETIVSSVNPHSSRNKFYEQPFLGQVFLDGEEFISDQLNTIYISSCGTLNFGVKGITLKVIPEARKAKGKVPIALSSESVWGVVSQLWGLYKGKELDLASYHAPEEVRIVGKEPIIYLVEDDLFAADELMIKYNRTLKFISPS
ncbi:MAG: hypothetical protein KKH52_01920 [Nanoarchaeota archaeon]|nr:hypothetical protein [Nanoarchaeota archaeon]MBU1623153.1 hypothetical protein [Nanoarchaeota archaeon]MBU1974128.1 hypothetical protein [Nanoarchaeota archaeon]